MSSVHDRKDFFHQQGAVVRAGLDVFKLERAARSDGGLICMRKNHT